MDADQLGLDSAAEQIKQDSALKSLKMYQQSKQKMRCCQHNNSNSSHFKWTKTFNSYTWLKNPHVQQVWYEITVNSVNSLSVQYE